MKRKISIGLLFVIFSLMTYAVLGQEKIISDTVICTSITKQIPKVIQVDTTIQSCVTQHREFLKQIAAHYLNEVSLWLYTDAGRKAMVNWLKSNGDNRAYTYGMDDAIESTRNWAAIGAFNELCYNAGISSAFVWSNANSVTGAFDRFQKAQTNVKCKFKGLQNEGEPYNNLISYQAWWLYGRQVRNYVDKYNAANADKLFTGVYVGWHSPQSIDSIPRLYDYVSMHVYIPSNRMGNAGSEYGYTNSRMPLYVQAAIKDGNTAFYFEIIFSSEKPFGYDYYIGIKGAWKKPYDVYLTGFNLLATPEIKRMMIPIGYVTFVSKESRKIKPIVGLPVSLMRAIEEPRTRKRVTMDTRTMTPIVVVEPINQE